MKDMKERAKELLEQYNDIPIGDFVALNLFADEAADFLTDFVYDE